MAYALPQTVVMADEQCISCGTPFAWPQYLRDARYRDGKTFYCPNGHGQSWSENDADRLRKQLDESTRANTRLAEQVRAAQMAEQAAEVARVKAERETKRIKKRVAAGICTCCNRTFQNLARHMATKHADAAV
jgi:hypothetical protein